MTEQLRNRLQPVRGRQHRVVLLQYAASGLLLGALAGVLLAIARLQGGAISPLGIVVAGLAGLVGGVIFGWACPPRWQESAAAVDSHYQLKDRSVTALDFAADPNASQLQLMQIHDALGHLENVQANDVVPFRIPRMLPIACLAFVLMVGLALIPLANTTAAKLTSPLDHIVSAAEYLEETMLAELERMKEEAKDQPELEQLVSELQDMLEQMKEPGVDQREALAKLSEMQAAVAAAQTEFNMDVIDANMRALGAAMAPALAMKAAASALQEGKYDKAAEKIEAIDLASLSKKEAKTVAEELKKVSAGMADTGLGQLSEVTAEYCEGLADGDPGKCNSGAAKLAKLSRTYALRKAVGMCLNGQLARLGECKDNCNKNGGLAGQQRSQPSNTWGRGSSGSPFGEATEITSVRQQDQITGTAGAGPSEREISHSPEGREAATRKSREIYREYRKQAEEVLQSEALPLGHRQTIRRYFASIRPEHATMTIEAEPSS